MNHYPRYPKYKDSGVDWIGNVPEHWAVLRLANIGPLMKANGGNRQDDAESGIPCIRYGDLYTTYDFLIRDIKKFISNESVPNYTPIQHGDILFAASGETFEEIGKSAVNLEECCAYCGGDLIVLRPQRPIDSVFLGYAAGSSSAQAQKSMMGKGFTVIHLYGDQLRNLVIAMPPEPEQKLIGDMIETETARIDALIAKKTRFIELLKEKRSALITHAVTKGLDPEVKMKDSGVEWIGEVPAHWEVVHAKRLISKMDYGLSETADQDGSIEFLTMGNIQDGEVILSGEKFLKTVAPDLLLQPNDILFNRTNSIDLVGKVGIYRGNGNKVTFASYLVRFRSQFGVSPRYLCYYLGSESVLAVARTMALPSVSQANLNPNRYGYLRAPLPPLDEQNRIADFIDAQAQQLDFLVEKTQHSIDLLKERRSAFITAAVTGQIDVRRSV